LIYPLLYFTSVKDFVKVRVTYKSRKKTTALGIMFDFHGMDETGETEASFVCYPNVVEKFYDMVQVVGSYNLNFHWDFRTHSLRTFSFR
jgi:hypothetical protein